MSTTERPDEIAQEDMSTVSPKQINRREMGKIALAAVAATQLDRSGTASAQAPPRSKAASPAAPAIRSAVKLSCIASVNPTDDDLLFYKQVGVDAVRLNGAKPEDCTVEGMLRIKKRYADAGVTIDKINTPVVDSLIDDIVLNRPGRDKAIESYKDWIHTLVAAGFYYIPQMFGVTGPLSSGMTDTRGGGKVKSFDIDSPTIGADGPNAKGGKGPANSLFFGREYTREEIWANYTYFIKAVAPVAEKAGVKIGIHPDDPPTSTPIFGVPRIFSSFDDYKRALGIANSPNVGVLLCCGTWEQGGTAMGIDTEGAIRYFGARKKIFELHFRNVSSPLPSFHQDFPDNGFYDTYKIMKALVDVGYDGVVNLENSVQMVGGVRTFEAFSLGYMRAMLQRAERAKAAGVA